jgi:putative cell wall-binding protein/photosystem II stability/assembly factor-like uncharacterized protein
MRRISAMLSVTLALAIVPLPSQAAPIEAITPTAIAPLAATTADLKCLTMVSASLGFAAGASGTIIKTTDGGDNWVKLSTGTTTADFRGIAFWSTTTGVAVTYDRRVYKTTNGGTSWTLANADMTRNAFGSPAIGVSGATSIPGSTDGAILFGGTTPTDGLYVSEQAWLSSGSGGGYWGNEPVLEPRLHVVDDGLGNEYAVGDGEMLALDFTDATHGWVVGDDMFPLEDMSSVYATSDGGYSWTRQTFPVPLRLTGVSFSGNSVGVIVSDEGRVFRTANGGTTWTEGTSPTTSPINGVALVDTSKGWAVGAGGNLLGTTNAGASWSFGTSPTYQDLYGIAFSGTHGIAVGKFGSIIVTDDGVNWRVPTPDTTGPTMQTLTSSTHPVATTWYSSASATVAWTATDPAGVSGYSYVFDTSPTTVPDTVSDGTASTATRTLGTGVNYVHVRAVDAYGNWGDPIHRTIRVDTIDPVTTDNAADAYTAPAVITLTPTDAHSGVANTSYALDGVPGTGTTVSVSSEGVHTLKYASVDAAGNREATVTVGVTVDFSGPSVTTLTSATHASAASWYSNHNPSFAWSASDAYSSVSGYSYVLDQSPATVPDEISEGSASAKSYTNLADGVWYLHVRAVDSLGNWGYANHIAIRIDTAPPSTTDDAADTYTGTAVINLTSADLHSGVASTRYALDGVPGTGTSVLVSSEGVHTLDYASIDEAGNREATVTVAFTIDLTGPSLTALGSLTHPSSGTWYSQHDPTFEWSATDPVGVAGYSYALDQSPATVPATTNLGTAEAAASANLTDGVWYFHIRAVDSLGNWSGTSRIPIRVDTTDPVTTNDAMATYTSPAVIVLTPTDANSGVANTYYVLDGAPGTGTMVVAATEGVHTLEYASVDAAGNRETTVTVGFAVGFTIDFSGPTMTSLTSSSHPSEDVWYTSNDPAFAWSATDTYSSVSGFSYVADQSPATEPDEISEGLAVARSYANLIDGVHYFHVRAVDSLGNWGYARHIRIRIDATLPTVNAVASTPRGEDATVTITAGDATSGLAQIDWQITGGASGSSSASPVQLRLSGVGTHTVTYWATDAAGNRSSKTIVVTIPRPDTAVVKVEGASRYATAIEASKLAFPSGATAVVIATGSNWPDALGGAALAGQVGGPILLTDPKTLSDAVRSEISRLGATKAYVLGSEAAVSKAVAVAVEAMPGVSVERLAGSNRYRTANAIARKATDLQGGLYDGTMFVATGMNFPDALAASPLSAAKGWPLYLAAPGGLPAETLELMKARGSRVIILGGTTAVSPAVEAQLRADFGKVTRIAGGDRYTTGLAVVAFGTGTGGAGLTWRAPAISTGTNFPDALSGGVLQGLDGSILLLTNGSSLTPAVGAAIAANKATIREVRYLGSTNAVSAAVRGAVQALIN